VPRPLVRSPAADVTSAELGWAVHACVYIYIGIKHQLHTQQKYGVLEVPEKMIKIVLIMVLFLLLIR